MPGVYSDKQRERMNVLPEQSFALSVHDLSQNPDLGARTAQSLPHEHGASQRKECPALTSRAPSPFPERKSPFVEEDTELTAGELIGPDGDAAETEEPPGFWVEGTGFTWKSGLEEV